MHLSDLLGQQDGVTIQGQTDATVTGMTADSRQVRAGFVFAALPSSVKNGRDGRDFIADAIKAGASAILVPKGSQITAPAGITIIESDRPRQTWARMAAVLAGDQPRHVVAVTGTNGKSSIVTFCRQLWAQLGEAGASLGTIGISATLKDGRQIEKTGTLTTPDPIIMHQNLAELAADGVTHLAIEASSQGLDQFRLDGVDIAAAAFTNLTRDHLDYHPDMAAYLTAKLRLFTEVLANNGVAVLNRDMPEYAQIAAACQTRGLRIIDVSANDAAAAIHIRQQKPLPHGQLIDMTVMGEKFSVELPLVGDFQAMNALMALALVTAEAPDDTALRHRVVAALAKLDSVRGRLELAGTAANGAAVYVDYAHTPDGLETMLKALRPHTTGKLHVVFGCGGDRDPGKRPQMGAIAARLADHIIVTDDNPRTEDATAIRAQVMAGVPQDAAQRTTNIGGRLDAMATALKALGPGDILVVAGKGHEQGQIVGTTVIPFDDVTEIKKLMDTPKNGADHASNASPVDARGDRRSPGPDHGRR